MAYRFRERSVLSDNPEVSTISLNGIPSSSCFTNTSLCSGGNSSSACSTTTLTPAPTPTLQPPQNHVVAEGETLFTLGFRYNVTSDSIAELNGLGTNANIIINQTLLIPWPTATPPLEPVLVEKKVNDFAAEVAAQAAAAAGNK